MTRDPYVDPDTGVLRNRLGLVDQAALDEAEADYSAVRAATIGHLPGEYDLAHLRAFHARVFGDVYPWAGELRTVGIDKGVPFCPPEHLASFAHDVFRRLAADGFLRGRGREAFLDGLTDLVGNLNALHPLSACCIGSGGGNGRTVRLFVAQLARDAGYDLRWRDMDPDENVAASRASLAGDDGPLRGMLDGLLHEA